MALSNQLHDYQLFRDFLQDSCGILLGDNKAYLVNSRLKPVLAKYKIADLGKLLSIIKQSKQHELREQVIDAMTTNETLWFRDTHPYEILIKKLFTELSSTKSASPIKIWSAACSTGQEPYSIAISAKEFQDKNDKKFTSRVKITATDISPSVLSNARAGVYQMLALGRGMSDARLNKCFTKVDEGSWGIKPEYKKMIDYKSLNLMDTFHQVGSNFDIIFCRNVLIYFSPDLKKQILTKMHKCLKKGGVLMLGASESLSGLSDYYEMEPCHPGIIYRAK